MAGEIGNSGGKGLTGDIRQAAIAKATGMSQSEQNKNSVFGPKPPRIPSPQQIAAKREATQDAHEAERQRQESGNRGRRGPSPNYTPGSPGRKSGTGARGTPGYGSNRNYPQNV